MTMSVERSKAPVRFSSSSASCARSAAVSAARRPTYTLIGSIAFRPEAALISLAFGPDAMNSRPARPSSSQRRSEAALPALSGEVGCGAVGSIRASNCWNEESTTRSATAKTTLVASDQNSSSAMAAPITLATRRGTKRRARPATRR